MADGLEFDAHSMEELGVKLREAAVKVQAEMEKTLLEVGELIKDEAKRVVEEAGSKSIAPTIRMVPGPGVAIVRAGSQDVPIASLWQLGNKGGKALAETFRHPVFGNKNAWVEQGKYPYLSVANLHTRPLRTKMMKKAWDNALAPYGLKPDWHGGDEEPAAKEPAKPKAKHPDNRPRDEHGRFIKVPK